MKNSNWRNAPSTLTGYPITLFTVIGCRLRMRRGIVLAPLVWRTRVWRPMMFALIFSAANQYLGEFIRNGPTRDWTNAIYPLSADVLQSHYGQIAGIDWGTVVPLGVLQRGIVPMMAVNVDDSDPDPAVAKMGKEGFVFLSHVNGQEYFAGVDDKMDGIAARHGFTKRTIRTFADENGRPVFELFQYQAVGTK
jgi:hypothetical protein